MNSPRTLHRYTELQQTVGDGKALLIAPLWAMVRRYVVITKNLRDAAATDAPDLEFTRHDFSSVEPSELVAIDRRLTLAEIDRRLGESQFCEIWKSDGKIIHFRWLAPARTALPFLGLEFEPASGDCLLFEVYTASGERVRGIHSRVARETLRRLGLAGYRRMVALCAWWNGPALRVGEKNEFRRVGSVTRWQLGAKGTFKAEGQAQLRGRVLSISGALESRPGANLDADGTPRFRPADLSEASES